MIALVLLALAAAPPPGLAFRLGPITADGAATIEVLDQRGRVATRIACPANQWIDARDSARLLMTSTEVMAHVIVTDGRLERLEQLGPARFACVIVPLLGAE